MLTRYDPFGSVLPLRDAMNQLLEGSFIAPWSQFSQSTRSIPIDVFEMDDAFVVKAFTPGLTPEQLEISVEQGTATISGEAKTDTPEHARILLNELRPGWFRRTFSLPLPIDADKVEARMDNGVLFLLLPKAEAAKPRKIQVNAA
jgi:HSP20 family protein